MFDLKRPCANCPFRKSMAGNYRLPQDRLDSIKRAVAFECHKTAHSKAKPQQCAGLMAVLHAEGAPNKIMITASHLIGYDPGVIETTDTFSSWGDVKKAHKGESV